MIDPELGEKRVCPGCAAKFYDLGKNPAVCPMCKTSFTAEPILPSKEDTPPVDEQKPADGGKTDGDDVDDVEIVSLDDLEVDAVEEEDDEAAAVKDVDLGEADGEPVAAGDDDTFLEDDDTGKDSVADLIVKPSADGDE